MMFPLQSLSCLSHDCDIMQIASKVGLLFPRIIV